MEFVELNTYDVISVFESKDGKFARLCYSNSEIDGKIEGIQKNGDAINITLNGVTFPVAHNYLKEAQKLSVGEEGLFGLTIYGEIATMKPLNISETWAYLADCAMDDGLDASVSLKLFCEDGKMYGEEYTLVTVADYVLKHTPGNTVSNLSSTRALRDVTRAYGCEYNAAAVGEVNVTTKMKETNAVIGGEGNGGVIYPESHYGRDALVGIALFLSHLAHEGKKVSELRATYPPYFIAKNRIDLTPETDVDAILTKVKEMYKDEEVNDIDGVKIDFPDKWVHLRKSNTEPIIRVYSEASTMEAADEIGQKIMDVVYSLAK
jgi:hypothetical protein